LFDFGHVGELSSPQSIRLRCFFVVCFVFVFFYGFVYEVIQTQMFVRFVFGTLLRLNVAGEDEVVALVVKLVEQRRLGVLVGPVLGVLNTEV